MENFDHILRSYQQIPIGYLGKGSFGHVNLAYDIDRGIIATKVIPGEKFDKKEIDSGIDIWKYGKPCLFVLKTTGYHAFGKFPILQTDYCNMKNLNIIAKQPQIDLPSFALRALMKQTLIGLQFLHSGGLIHRDIKSDNVLLHSPPGSGKVYVQIADFGLTKMIDDINGQSYAAGTLPFMAPEVFNNQVSTQKVDIFATGITFYRLLAHIYPMDYQNFHDYQMAYQDTPPPYMQPTEIKDPILWDLLSKMLEFDPDKRITASEALEHEYFTGPEAIDDISPEQRQLAEQARQQDINEDIREYEINPQSIVPESVIKKFLISYIQHKPSKQSFEERDKEQKYNDSFKDILHQEEQEKQNEPYINDSPSQITTVVTKDSVFIAQESSLLQSYTSQSSSDIEAQLSSQQTNFDESTKLQQQSNEQSNKASLSYAVSQKQLQIEKDLLEVNTNLEEIKEQIDQFEKLSDLKKDFVTLNLHKLLKKNQENCLKASELGIVDKLLEILEDHPVMTLYPMFSQPLQTYINSSPSSVKDSKLQEKVLIWIKRILESDNEMILFKVFQQTTGIIYDFGNKQGEGKPNPLLKDMMENGTLSKLLKMLKNDKYVDWRL